MKWFRGSSNTNHYNEEQEKIDYYQKLLEAKSYDIYFYTKGNETACMVYEPRGGMRFGFGVLGRSKLDAL